jgi:hypothetical protein
MSWLKRELVSEAYAEIAMHDSVFNIDPDMLATALRRLDAMMATWNAKGIRVGYNLPSLADGSNLQDDSGLPDAAYEAVILNLAIRLAPGVGKAITPATAGAAKQAYDTLLAICAKPGPMRFPSTLPSGSGNRHRYSYGRDFMRQSAPDITAGKNDSDLDFN